MTETFEGKKNIKPDSKIGFKEVWASPAVDGRVYQAKVEQNGSKVGKDDVTANTQGYTILGNEINMFDPAGRTYAEGSEEDANAVHAHYKWGKDREKLPAGFANSSIGKATVARMDKRIEPAQRRLADAQSKQQLQHQIEDNIQQYYANCGKDLKRLKLGQDQWGNIVTSGLGMLGGIGQIIHANGQSLNNPNIYAPNQYERQGLTTLANLRDNPYNQLRAMQDVEARNRYAISQSGGLTGAQKYMANVAGGIGLQKNYADVLYRSNEANNKYKAQWANAALQIGAANAQRQQAANQYRDEAYARSHAAREQMRQMGLQNTLGQMQQYYANEFKRRQFERMMDLYWSEQMGKYPYLYGTRGTSQTTGKFVPKDEVFVPKSLQGQTLPNNANALRISEWKKILGIKDRELK